MREDTGASLLPVTYSISELLMEGVTFDLFLTLSDGYGLEALQLLQ